MDNLTLSQILGMPTGGNSSVAQPEQQSITDNTTPGLFDVAGGVASTPTTSASSDKSDVDKLRLLLELSKSGQVPAAIQTEQLKLANQPDTALVNQESQNLQSFLHNLFTNISGNPIPDKDLYQLDTASIKAAGLAQKDIKSRMAAVDQALKEIPVNPTSGVPKTMANYYNSLLVEKNLLNNLGGMLSGVSEKNPTIPSSAIHNILNQSALFGSQQPSGSTNPYGLDNKQITDAILSKMGRGITPEMQTFQDWQAYSNYIDQYMKPFIARSMSSLSPQGGSLGDVNKRLAFNSLSESDRNKAIEKAAGQGLANFVNITQTLDPKFRQSLWNMLPIWAAQQGLNWQNVKNQGLQHAENLVTTPKESTKNTTSSVAKPKPMAKQFAPESKEEVALPATDPSLLTQALSPVAKAAKNYLIKPAEGFGETLGGALNLLTEPGSQAKRDIESSRENQAQQMRLISPGMLSPEEKSYTEKYAPMTGPNMPGE